MAERHLSVQMHGSPAATLTQDDSGRLWLQYLAGVTEGLSLCLPVQADAHPPEVTEPFFGNLLPEGEAMREAIAKRTGANPRNTFSLLRAVGQECAGAISLHDLDAPVVAVDPVPIRARVLPEDELARHLAELPRRPLMIGVDGLRLSLAGAQEKAAVCLVSGEVAVPLDGTPSTYILKPAHPVYPHMVDNEHLCLALARELGLEAPRTEVRQVDGRAFLLVERYDRVVDADARIRRLHQEDFCQALGVSYASKYQSDGGPGLAQCFQLMDRLAVPAAARLDLLKRFAFNLLVGNCDAHAKNYSLLYRGPRPVLAPVYDVLCTRYYDDLSSKLAMNVGGENDLTKVGVGDLRRLCERTGVGFPLLKRTLASTNKGLREAIDARLQTEQDPARRDILSFIKAHAGTLMKRFASQESAGR